MSSGTPPQNALPHRVRVEERPGIGKCIVASESVDADQLVLACPCDKGTIIATPSMHSLQVSEKEHCDVSNDLQYTAHSCAPNCVVVIDRRAGTVALRALVAIRAGDVISFDYNATEWDISCPFPCACGAPHCHGQVRGYRHLDAATRARLAEWAQPWLVEAGAQRL